MAQNYNLVKITQVENATISTQILNYNYAEQFFGHNSPHIPNKKHCLASTNFLVSTILNHSQCALHATGYRLPVPRKNIT